MATLTGSHTRADGERMVGWEQESLREHMQARPTRVDAMMASMVPFWSGCDVRIDVKLDGKPYEGR